ncbi:YraN family protein [Coralloluteibacterium stylophorae]|uniref:UPF0102 protein KB893_011495 n=1 Tax=Coralloluteibacterium stylophorae TaxID=1776034 RepID=A0A8J7VXC3_9GAMM|nr:YraN family protein [Coralloluteibacterium stylophorae]
MPSTDGAAWEACARRHLERAGLRTLAANVRFRGGEIDLVMRDGAALVFVEVRYRSHAGYGGGAISVDARKQRKLALAAQLYLAGEPRLQALPCRFDVVALAGTPAAPQVEWIRDAFRLDDL